MLTKSTETERTQGKNIGKYNHKGEKNKKKKRILLTVSLGINIKQKIHIGN